MRHHNKSSSAENTLISIAQQVVHQDICIDQTLVTTSLIMQT